MQQDAHELITLVLARLRGQVEEGTACERSMQYMFVGKQLSFVTRVVEGHARTTVSHDETPLFSVCIDGVSTNLLGAILASVATERVEFESAQADKQMVCTTWPAVLQIQLKRFIYDGKRNITTKYNGKLTFRETLDLTSYCQAVDGIVAAHGLDPSSELNNVYKLHSVVVHRGTVERGHYYMFVRPTCAGEEWFRCDDTSVTRTSAANAMDDNFGGGGACQRHSAYLLVYIRECDVPSHVLNPCPSQAMPAEFVAQCSEQEANYQRLASSVTVRYCTSDDLMGVSDIGLLPADFRFRTVVVRTDSTIGQLRSQLAASLQWPLHDVLVLGYMPDFASCYADDLRPVAAARVGARRQPQLARDSGEVLCACRRSAILNACAQGAVHCVVVIKTFSAAEARLTVRGLAHLASPTYAELEARVRELLPLCNGPLVMCTEPAAGRAPVRITCDDTLPIPAGSIVVVELEPAATPGFAQFFREMHSRCTLELRHEAPPDEQRRPTLSIKCLPTRTYQDVVSDVRTLAGVPYVRLLKHDSVRNAAVISLGDFEGTMPISTMYTPNRSAAQRYVLHYEVLDCEAEDLAWGARVSAFVCAGGLRVHQWLVLPRTHTALQICESYQDMNPELVPLKLRVLIVDANFLVGVMRDDDTVERVALQSVRVEEVPPRHEGSQADATIVPVHVYQIPPPLPGPFLLPALVSRCGQMGPGLLWPLVSPLLPRSAPLLPSRGKGHPCRGPCRAGTTRCAMRALVARSLRT